MGKSDSKKIRIIDLGEVPPVRSQTCYHAVGYAFTPETSDTIILVSPQSPYVCLGFHQEAEREIDLTYCQKARLPVYRREVGGGAVYLDRDQLFVQWIFHPESLPELLEDRFRLYAEPIIRAYHDLGIEAYYQPVNDILVSGKKICGTGAAKIGLAEVLVGSFMLDFDKKTMSRVLKIPTEKMRDKIFQSLEQYMTTMKELLKKLPERSELIKIYLRKVTELLGSEIFLGELTEKELKEAERLDQLFQQEDWIFQKGTLKRPGIRIHQDIQLYEADYKAPGGLIRITARTRSSNQSLILDSVWISGDFTVFPKEGLTALEKALAGVKLEEGSIHQAIERVLAQTCLESPGIKAEDWVSALLKIRDLQQTS